MRAYLTRAKIAALQNGLASQLLEFGMSTLRNLLIGLGGSMNPFGTVPQYSYPQVGDRARDLKKISGDQAKIGKDMKKAVETAMREANGKVDSRTGERAK